MNEAEKSREIFNTRSQKYDDLKWVFNDQFREIIINLVDPKSTDIMLDLGAGSGAIADFFYSRVKKVVAVDISESMLEKARVLLSDADNVEFILSDGQATGLKDEHFDHIVCRNALHHFTDPVNGLKEINRMLKPDGVFTLIEPVPPNQTAKTLWSALFLVRDKGRYPDFYFTPEELIDFVRSEFEVIATASNQIQIPMSNWLNIDSLSKSDIEQIYEFLQNSTDEEHKSLGIYQEEGDWQMTHSWSLLKLVKK